MIRFPWFDVAQKLSKGSPKARYAGGEMRTLLAMTFATGFLAAAAFAFPACGSSSGTPDAGTGGAAGSGGTKGSGGSKGTGTGGTKGTGTGGSGGTMGSPTDGGACTMPADAGGLLPAMCITCLASQCTSDFNACFCDPSCVNILKDCFDPCVADGGSPSGCGLSCSEAPDVGTSGSNALTLLICAEKECQTDAEPGCKAPAADSGAK
jgi:hypothetical protein